MKKFINLFALFLMSVFHTACGQNQTIVPKDTIKSETKDSITSHGPNSIVRTIIQDRKGNIWMASWEGIFRYDGKSFTNITNKVSSARFFSVLEERKGNIWFSADDGLWRYDGSTFTKLSEKGAISILEDKKGNIWTTSVEGRGCELLRYDGKSLSDQKPTVTIVSDGEYNLYFGILEAFDGSIWVGSGSGVYRYDGKTFTAFKNKDSQK